jgi:hypothetical protein
LLLIQFFVAAKLYTSASFRSMEKLIVTLNLCLDLELGQPCYGTILVWTKKVGLFTVLRPKEKADDWVLIIDESIDIGHERLLVIYGIRASKIEFNRALDYMDLTPFLIKSGSQWTSEIIKKEIDSIINLWGDVKYIVADGGNAICKSIKLLSKIHVYDITHKIAWFLKQMYQQDISFIGYTKAMAQMRFKYVCSDISHIIPPKQRVDSRFMNLKILSNWGMKALHCLDLFEKESKVYQKLQWVITYKEFITELNMLNQAISQIQTIIKTKGLSNKTIKVTHKILSHVKPGNQRIQYFYKEMIKYLKETKAKLPGEEKILCTSDIIESSFGKYKNYLYQNPIIGITNLSLCLAAFTSKLDAENLKTGLETVKINDLKKWSKDNIGETNLSKRKRVLIKNGA